MIWILLLREGGVVEDRGGRKNNVCSYFFVNDRIMSVSYTHLDVYKRQQLHPHQAGEIL